MEVQVPFIQAENSSSPNPEEEEEEPKETQINKSLHLLETFLRVLGFCQYSFLSFTLSWISFLLLGILLPLLIIEISYCSSDCVKYQIKIFELEILVSQSLGAAISLLCVSHNLRKYGVRRFLFVDKCHGHMTQFREEYTKKIRVTYIQKPTVFYVYIFCVLSFLLMGIYLSLLLDVVLKIMSCYLGRNNYFIFYFRKQ